MPRADTIEFGVDTLQRLHWTCINVLLKTLPRRRHKKTHAVDVCAERIVRQQFADEGVQNAGKCCSGLREQSSRPTVASGTRLSALLLSLAELYTAPVPMSDNCDKGSLESRWSPIHEVAA